MFSLRISIADARFLLISVQSWIAGQKDCARKSVARTVACGLEGRWLIRIDRMIETNPVPAPN